MTCHAKTPANFEDKKGSRQEGQGNQNSSGFPSLPSPLHFTDLFRRLPNTNTKPTAQRAFHSRSARSSAIHLSMSAVSVVLHLDLDCFYAQVERERLGLAEDAAIVVVQWRMALAVSYPARKFGINRGSNVDDIRRLAGDKVTVVFVETIGGDVNSTTALEKADGSNLVNTQKVSLARYRNASARVFAAMTAALAKYNVKFERASIDEAYIDVTAEVDRRVRAAVGETRERPEGTVVVGERLDLQNEVDARLAYGADIAAEVRARVFADCGYTVSAGICVNKLLAKFASAQNKPNQQTIVPISAVPALMADVPLRKLRGLGGKLGKEVEALGVATAGEATALSIEKLEKALGQRKLAVFVYNSVRGKDDSEVSERDKTKSLLAAKSFGSQYSLAPVEKQWLPILAEELAERLLADLELYNRDAKTLVVSFRLKAADGVSGMLSASRSTSMPAAAVEGRTDAILSSAIRVLRRAVQEKHFTFPITFIGLTATNFLDRANINESIERYFRPGDKDGVAATDGPGDLSSNAEKKTVLDSKEAHQRRLQAKSDKELALRLHREESLRSTGKQIRKPAAWKGGGIGTSKRNGKGKGFHTFTMDQFVFKKKDDKPHR